MRILDIRERSFAISRYADPTLPSGGLTTSAVAVVTDVVRDGRPVTGYGFASMGRYAQGGLIRERFAPRLLAAPPEALLGADGALDPFRAWAVMMQGEKPGGHGERCVAIGTLDMALWDAAAKIAGAPVAHHLAAMLARSASASTRVYAGGGYRYPERDVDRLRDEVLSARDAGYAHVKIKVGNAPLAVDGARIDAAAEAIGGPERVAIDAMNAYDRAEACAAAAAFDARGLWWFEDVTDPLDFGAWAAVAQRYRGPIAAGEALFSEAEARLLDDHAGLRRERDVLVFDPVHAYGVPGYLRIVETLEARGWPRSAFWPHGGHLFALHLACALGLGGTEVNPFAFPPFGGLHDGAEVRDGRAAPPDEPGIGFEQKAQLWKRFREL